ncbi:MAG: hypothetical protein A3G41_03005 [Elusimicrobia bacterium RIFCSPLOWO2_12_FULL_59_9]|nr:MAG: hypothetical protein A3G41_03005 [Elusimicrobia bacterium RIFCSPLOWO2_12_FULL_59_9]
MKRISGLKACLAPAAFCGALAAVIYQTEGVAGFRFFLNAEALALVVGGTLLLVWAAYPLEEVRRLRSPEMLAYAARSAKFMGLLGTLLGVMMMLPSAEVSEMPRRLVLALNALLFGLILAEAVFVPWARRLERKRVVKSSLDVTS